MSYRYLIRVLKPLAILSFPLVLALWLICANALSGYFNSFFIDATPITTIGNVWDFAAQKYQPLIDKIIICSLILALLIYSDMHIRKFIPNKQLGVKVKIRLLPRVILKAIEYFAYIVWIALSILIITGIFSADGRVLAGIDKQRFNEGNIILQRLSTKDTTPNVKSCIGILARLGDSTFIIYPDLHTSLLNNDKMISIDSMFYRPKQGKKEEGKSVRDACPLPKQKFSTEEFQNNKYLNFLFNIAYLLMAPTKPF